MLQQHSSIAAIVLKFLTTENATVREKLIRHKCLFNIMKSKHNEWKMFITRTLPGHHHLLLCIQQTSQSALQSFLNLRFMSESNIFITGLRAGAAVKRGQKTKKVSLSKCHIS